MQGRGGAESRTIGRLISLVAALALLGCRDDKIDQAAKCEFEAQKMDPSENTATSPTTGKFIELCMRAIGYDFDYDNLNCLSPGPAEERRNPYCYRLR